MEKIFERSSDLHVAARVIYAKAGDAYAYADSAKAEKIDAKTLEDLFAKGVLIADGDSRYKPVSLLTENGVATISYVKADTVTASTAILATLASKEHTASV